MQGPKGPGSEIAGPEAAGPEAAGDSGANVKDEAAETKAVKAEVVAAAVTVWCEGEGGGADRVVSNFLLQMQIDVASGGDGIDPS